VVSFPWVSPISLSAEPFQIGALWSNKKSCLDKWESHPFIEWGVVSSKISSLTEKKGADLLKSGQVLKHTFKMSWVLFHYNLVYFLVGYTVSNNKPNVISQVLYVSMKTGFQWISSQFIFDCMIFQLNKWYSDSASESLIHSGISVLEMDHHQPVTQSCSLFGFI